MFKGGRADRPHDDQDSVRLREEAGSSSSGPGRCDVDESRESQKPFMCGVCEGLTLYKLAHLHILK